MNTRRSETFSRFPGLKAGLGRYGAGPEGHETVASFKTSRGVFPRRAEPALQRREALGEVGGGHSTRAEFELDHIPTG